MKWLPKALAAATIAGLGALAPHLGDAVAAAPAAFHVRSSQLVDGTVPMGWTCDGPGRTPTLEWEDPPPNTQSFAVVVTDRDAPSGPFTHWAVWNIDPDVRQLGPENANDFSSGRNSADKLGWAAICPPRHSADHHYEFTVYALDDRLHLDQGAKRDAVLGALKGHVLAQDQMVGAYRREPTFGTM